MLVTQKFPHTILSRTKIVVLCQCGRKSNILYGNLAKTKTCGKCSYKPINYWLDQSFGHLKLDTKQNLPIELPKTLKSKLPTLWTNSYFVSTVGGAPLAVIKQYVENQKNV